MKKQTSLALAMVALLSGVTAASAATMSKSAHSMMSKPAQASDTLSLSSKQQQTAWEDLDTPSLNQTAPSGFNAAVGATIPGSVTTAPMTKKASSDIPTLKPYHFAMLQKKLLIVNPADKKIADVITE